jgi:hypothetical protein
MRGILRKLRGPSVLPKIQRNLAVVLRTRFRTLWSSDILLNLKIYADALYRRQRRFCFRRTIFHIYQGK